jgi:hypothetical protein
VDFSIEKAISPEITNPAEVAVFFTPSALFWNVIPI